MKTIGTILGIAVLLALLAGVGYVGYLGLGALGVLYRSISVETRAILVLASLVFLVGALIIRSGLKKGREVSGIQAEKGNVYLEFLRNWPSIYLEADDEAMLRQAHSKALFSLWAGESVLEAFLRFLDAHERNERGNALAAKATEVLVEARKDLGHRSSRLAKESIERMTRFPQVSESWSGRVPLPTTTI